MLNADRISAPMNDNQRISSWVAAKSISVLDLFSRALRALHFNISIGVTNNIVAIYVSGGSKGSIINISRLLIDIATINGSFDARLVDQFYETGKIYKMIGDRIGALETIMNSDNKAQIVDKLCELSSAAGVNFRVIEQVT